MSDTVYQTMLARRSIRKYTNEPVNEEQIQRLLEAAMAAPSASNLQPWHFMVVTERRLLDALANAHPYGKMLLEAPLCIVVCAEPENSHWMQDCSAATENILLAATELGLGGVWCAVAPDSGREHDIRDILGIPAHMTPLNLIPIGHPNEKKEPRTQFKAERVHRNAW